AYLALEATEELSKNDYAVSVLSLGTQQGGTIPNVVGRDRKPIVVPMQEDVLKSIAEKGQGRYSVLQSGSADIDYLLALSSKFGADKAERADDVNNQDWKSEGPLLVLLLLPLAALAFRRGWLLSVGLVVITFGQPQPVMASMWDNLWTRQDQQADQALQRGDFDQAQQLANDPLRRGSAAFKKGEYEQALSDFSEAEGADAAYNKGNALAQLKQYEEAIKAYDDALKQQSNMQDAKDNKAKIEALLKQQKEQEKKQKNQDKDQDQKDQQNKDDKKKQDSKSGEESNEDKEKPEQEQQEGEPEDKEKEKEQSKKGQSKENQFEKANEASEEEKKKDEEQENKQGEEQDQQTAQQKAEQEKQQAMAEKELKEKANEGAEGKEAQAKIEADALSKEEKIAAEQWLRRIPDNPGELLKRKFKYQYKRRGQSSSGGRAPW
ncbi:MAG: tetratricopeptide repeat protein, partial [Thiotrichaceae bacterium]